MPNYRGSRTSSNMSAAIVIPPADTQRVTRKTRQAASHAYGRGEGQGHRREGSIVTAGVIVWRYFAASLANYS